MSLVILVTHPDVVVDPAVPVPEWRLSDAGLARTRRLADAPFVASLAAVASSTERKALDTAELLAARAAVTLDVHAGLGENDRSSTGFLSPDAFQRHADAFFARPDASVAGWETARAAQKRMVAAVDEVLGRAPPGDVAIVAHGGVGALLLCALRDAPIDRRHDQPSPTGGCLFTFTRAEPRRVVSGWATFEDVAGRSP